MLVQQPMLGLVLVHTEFVLRVERSGMFPLQPLSVLQPIVVSCYAFQATLLMLRQTLTPSWRCLLEHRLSWVSSRQRFSLQLG